MKVMLWLRRRYEANALAAAAKEEREARRRYIGTLEAQRAALLARAKDLFRQPTPEMAYDERRAIYCRAMAAEARASALFWLIGGDAEAAAKLTTEAEEFDRLAGAPREVASKPVEAAHA
jgi:hypothetical protein